MIIGLYMDNGKENGNYYIIIGSGVEDLRFGTTVLGVRIGVPPIHGNYYLKGLGLIVCWVWRSISNCGEYQHPASKPGEDRS